MRFICQASAGALISAASLIGCGTERVSDPTSSSAPASRAQLQTTENQQRITGVAFITLTEAGGALERFTFSAVRHRDGRVTGQFQLFTEQEGGIRLHGIISCLGIRSEDGELIGHLGGTVTRSTLADLEGQPLIWTVVDEGEGRGALPDVASDLFGASPEELEDFCAFEFGLPINVSERGNIQVHP